jgi:hypothetical protein
MNYFEIMMETSDFYKKEADRLIKKLKKTKSKKEALLIIEEIRSVKKKIIFEINEIQKMIDENQNI